MRRPDPSDPANIYDASVVGDSAEDLRAVIAQQEKEADRLENVRACCDGEYDASGMPILSVPKQARRHVTVISGQMKWDGIAKLAAGSLTFVS